MKWKIRKIVGMMIGVSCCFSLPAQTTVKEYPVVGQPVPEFKLTNVDYYKKKSFEPADAKGKWLILDFWGLGCVSCVQSFPKVNRLQAEFKDQVQFLLVGDSRKYNKGIKEAFEEYSKRLELNLAIAYDSTLIERFGVQSFPHVIIVDPEGKVFAVTTSASLTHDNLQALTSNKNPILEVKDNAFGKNQSPKWDYGMDNKRPSADLLFRSVLSSNQGEEFNGVEFIDAHASDGFFEATHMDLARLYRFAYLGESGWSPADTLHYNSYCKKAVLEVRNPSLFQYDYNTNTGFYNYSLVIPREKSTKEYLMKRMQSDLCNYFGFTATVETRMMPYWKLTATEVAKKQLKSQHTKEELLEWGPALIKGKGVTVGFLLAQVIHYSTEQIPFMDETGITGRIDINIKAALIDMEDVQKALSKQGLILEKSSKPMKALIIREIPIFKK